MEWTGTDTILARLFSVANSFDAELDFNVELNDDYSLKRQVLNIYKKGNLGTNKVSRPVRVGKELKVINYSDNIKELRTAVRATGKDGLTIDGLNKKIYDDNKELLYYSSGNTVYAPQSRDRFPSVGKGSNDNWIVEDLGETQHETKEALWAYLYGEIQKKSLPKITYEVEGAIDAGIGDTQILIDDVHFEPTLYVQARVSELEDDILTGRVTKSTFINFERKYSQIADSLLKQVEVLAEDAAPYIVRLSTDNGYNFKNGQGSSTITAKLEKYSKIVNADWKWLINNSVVSETSSVKINASQVNGTLNVVAVAIVGGNEAAREYITFTNADDGVGIKSIKRYYTTNDQAEGVTAGGQNWSTKPTTVTADKNYMWSYDVITYTNDTSLVTEPAVIGARGNDGLDADTTGITEALDKAKQELTALSANIEKVRDDSLAAVNEAKQQLTTVADDLNTAKQDLQTQASQLQAQVSAQSELTKRVSTVEETANGTKTTVSELSKTVDSNTKNITSVTARTKTVEDDLTSTKTTLSQVQTTADSASQKTATLETSLNGVKTDLTATTTTANTTKQNLASYQASNDKVVANLQSNLQTANGNISSLQTKVEAVPGQITSAVSAVEGKIPTNLDSLNLMTGTRDWSTKTNKWHMGANWSTENEEYQGLKVHSTQNGYNGSHQNIFVKNGDIVTFSFFAKATNTLSKIKVSSRWQDSSVYQAPLAGVKESDEQITITSEWKRYSKTVHITSDGFLQFRTEYDGSTIPDGNTFYVAGLKLAKSALDTGYSENPTDAASDLSAVSSELKQTKDGMTLLATKTELNTAKSDLQSGISTATSKADNAQATANSNAQTISTHTTQISALNTGLSAKVSQTDFNTLSGRVTTAENNITIKANELSSKITSVEGKIPTELGTKNLIIKSAAQVGSRLSIGTQPIADKNHMLTDWIKIEPSTVYTLTCYEDVNEANMYYSLAWYSTNSADYSGWISRPTGAATAANLKGGRQYTSPANAAYAKVSYPTKYSKIKLERGKVSTDYTPAPEDYDSKLASAQSEIKQTTDAISASVSSVETKADTAQSTANTAVSKADAAQAGVNTLNSTTVKTATLNLDNNGFVTKVGKTVNGNTFATMIAQNESDVQIIAKKMKVSGDMIVNGAITADKLNINSLSALSADLGNVTSGSITNSFVDYTRSGTIKIDNSITIDTKDTSPTVANKANQHIKMNSSGFSLTVENSSNTPVYSMQIMPESINFNKLDYDTTRGGTSGWNLTHNGYYSMLQVDIVWQNVRIYTTSNMPYGTKANFIRIGNLVTISVNRQITNINVVTENQLAIETIPEGFRPITQAHLTLTGNTGSTIDATCICHLDPDGTIRFTNNRTGDRVWTGTVTYTCVEPMPYVENLNNGYTI